MASPALLIQPPKIDSPLSTLAQIAQLRGAGIENILRLQQVQQSAAQTSDLQAQAAQKNRDLSDQNNLAEFLKDPAKAAKFWSGNFEDIDSLGLQPKTVDDVKTKVHQQIAATATQSTAQLELKSKLHDQLGETIAAIQRQAGTGEDFDPVKANSLLSGALQEYAPQLKQAGYDTSKPLRKIQTEDDLNGLAADLGALGSTTAAAQKLKKGQAEIGQATSQTVKNEADAAKAHADAEEAAAKLPGDQAAARISQINADFAAAHGGQLPEQVATTQETARHNKQMESIQGGELALKQKTFEATLGSGLDANGVPLPPDAAKAAAMNDPTAVAIAHYQVAPPPAQTRGGLPSPVMRKVLLINPQYQATNYAANAETARGFSPSGVQGQAITAADTALSHLNTLSAAGEALKNGDVQLMNRVANAVGAQVGDSPKTTYDTILNMVGPEISKAVIGAVGGEGERVATAANFDSSKSPQQREQAIAAAVGLLGARFDKASHAYESQMGVPLPRTLSLESQSIRQKYQGQAPGATPATAPTGTKRISSKAEFDALPSGTQYIDPGDGKTYRKP